MLTLTACYSLAPKLYKVLKLFLFKFLKEFNYLKYFFSRNFNSLRTLTAV